MAWRERCNADLDATPPLADTQHAQKQIPSRLCQTLAQRELLPVRPPLRLARVYFAQTPRSCFSLFILHACTDFHVQRPIESAQCHARDFAVLNTEVAIGDVQPISTTPIHA